MKKLNYLWMLGLLMFAAVNFTACSDDDDAPGASSDLVGLWESVSYEGWEKYKGEIVDEWEEFDDDRIKFNSDGTWVSYYYSSPEWKVDNSGTWKHKNGKLYMTYDDEEDAGEEVVTLKELTSSRFVVEFYSSTGDYEYWEKDTYRKID